MKVAEIEGSCGVKVGEMKVSGVKVDGEERN